MEVDVRGPRSLVILAVLVTVAALACVGFLALGAWQLQRLNWKEALIARVQRNMNAAPTPAPQPAQWAGLTRDDEYRRVRIQGRFGHDRAVLVRATTALGTGHWVMTPMRSEHGWWLVVNRGFVGPELRSQVPRGADAHEVAGLLRWSEPGGSLLQDNDPTARRWYSRDVAAIAAAQGLQGPVAPYFIDAQPAAAAVPGAEAAWPRAGLTVVHFRNDHLVYGLTWFALAAIVAAAMGYLALDERRLRRQSRSSFPC